MPGKKKIPLPTIFALQFEVKIQPEKYFLYIDLFPLSEVLEKKGNTVSLIFPLFFLYPVYGGRESKNHSMSSKPSHNLHIRKSL